MKRNQVINIYTALLGVKLNKMSEKMTDSVLANTLSLATINEQMGRVREELHRRTLDGIDRKRLEEYDNLITKMNALSGQNKSAIRAVINDKYADVVKAQNTFVKALNKWLDKDVDVEIETIDRKEFIKALKESEQPFTPADIDVLSALFSDYKVPESTIDTEEIDNLIKED